MMLKKRLFLRSNLCVILDRSLLDDSRIIKIAGLCIAAGADMLQLRDKASPSSDMVRISKMVLALTKKAGMPFIVNDRIDVALAVNADGIHIGQGDIKAALARKLLGAGKLVGVSVSGISQARKARACGADYLGVGPVFKTPLKRGILPVNRTLLSRLKRLRIPYFAIGGIDARNAGSLAFIGVQNVAVIRAVICANNPYKAVRALKEAII
jgi:thiamine-phosphate pyrophosphorylase